MNRVENAENAENAENRVFLFIERIVFENFEYECQEEDEREEIEVALAKLDSDEKSSVLNSDKLIKRLKHEHPRRAYQEILQSPETREKITEIIHKLNEVSEKYSRQI